MTTADIFEFNGVTRLDMDPDRLLQAAVGKLETVVIVGYDKDGREFFASSVADGAESLWLLQRSAHKLLCMPDAED